MSAKCLDQQGRWRNKVVAFRMSPEEDELLEKAVRLSGLTKQEYIIRRLQEKEVVVTGNPRVYKALKKELEKVLGELKRLKKGEDVPEDLLEVIRLITIGYNSSNDRYGLLSSDLWIDTGFHCGECLEVLIDDQWVQTRMEMNPAREWYLVGTPYCGDLEYIRARIQ